MEATRALGLEMGIKVIEQVSSLNGESLALKKKTRELVEAAANLSRSLQDMTEGNFLNEALHQNKEYNDNLVCISS